MRNMIFEIDRDTKITVYNITNGLYRFYNKSATGKSWLYDTLVEYRGYGEPVDGYTYSDFKNGKQISELIGKGLRLVVLDRYDLYNGEMAEDIYKLSKECIVILDCKHIVKMSYGMKYVNITVEDSHILLG